MVIESPFAQLAGAVAVKVHTFVPVLKSEMSALFPRVRLYSLIFARCVVADGFSDAFVPVDVVSVTDAPDGAPLIVPVHADVPPGLSQRKMLLAFVSAAGRFDRAV